jgi:hypothetical protein
MLLLRLFLVLSLLFVLSSALPDAEFEEYESTLPQRAWMKAIRPLLSVDENGGLSNINMHSVLTHLADQMRSAYPDLPEDPRVAMGNDSFVYFGFIPQVVGSVLPNSTFSWSAPCFGESNVAITLERNDDGTSDYVLSFVIKERVGPLGCEDLYLIATTGGAQLVAFVDLLGQDHKVRFKLPYKGNQSQIDAELWDLDTNGFRIVRFRSDRAQLLADILATADLFIPALVPGPGVPEKTQLANHEFLQGYAGINMEPRNNTLYALDESEIHSGDFLGVIRLDGLDPMLAWGMGSHTGHTTIALWIDGELYICESTTNSNYWPTNNIQKTPYQTWLSQAYAADYNVVHLPLSNEARARFNETAAVEWFLNVAQGLPYGFNNMLLTWLDTNALNLPCLPNPDWDWCLQPLTVEVLASIVDLIDGKLGDLMYNLAFKRRLNPSDPDNSLRFSEVLQISQTQLNLNATELAMLPEQDEWVYPTGYQMVCDVLVCETWKQGNMFGDLTDSIQCTEFTNWDAYSLNIFNQSYVRPAACVEADPDSQFCQLMGAYRMSLPGYNSKQPYANMAENCPSRGPAYDRPASC